VHLQVLAASALPPCPDMWGSLELGERREGEGLCSWFIVSLLPSHRLLLREELSTAALSYHLVRFVICG